MMVDKEGLNIRSLNVSIKAYGAEMMINNFSKNYTTKYENESLKKNNDL